MREPPQRAAPKMEEAGPLIDAMLRQDLDAPRKQRHTARRVLTRLIDEHDITDVSYSTVRDYVARRRPEINIEAGRVMESVFVPQSHAPGAEGGGRLRRLVVDLLGGADQGVLVHLPALALGQGRSPRVR